MLELALLRPLQRDAGMRVHVQSGNVSPARKGTFDRSGRDVFTEAGRRDRTQGGRRRQAQNRNFGCSDRGGNQAATAGESRAPQEPNLHGRQEMMRRCLSDLKVWVLFPWQHQRQALRCIFAFYNNNNN